MEYDYIIVGAGSAACILATRLTENPHCRVALLEAVEVHRSRVFDKLQVCLAAKLATLLAGLPPAN